MQTTSSVGLSALLPPVLLHRNTVWCYFQSWRTDKIYNDKYCKFEYVPSISLSNKCIGGLQLVREVCYQSLEFSLYCNIILCIDSLKLTNKFFKNLKRSLILYQNLILAWTSGGNVKIRLRERQIDKRFSILKPNNLKNTYNLLFN